MKTQDNFSTADHNCKSQRDLHYHGHIPYYILFDLDLNAHHLRLYALIEQLESNPNPKVIPHFSYTWFASQIGVKKREAMYIAKVMKDKKYLKHIQLPDGRWIWGTVKNVIIESEIGGGAIELHGGVQSDCTGGVQRNCTLNTNKIKHTKDKTTTTTRENPSKPAEISSSSFLFSETTDRNLLNQKLNRDERTDEEFMAQCLEHVENFSDKKFPILQRANALVKLLKNLKASDVIFRETTKKETEKKKLFADETDDQRKERQWYTNEIQKERDNPTYISEFLQKMPEMRERYSKYVR